MSDKKYIIRGGTPLKGKVVIAGSKNSALPILSATLLTDKKIILNNIPVLRDTITMISLLEKLGKKIHFNTEKNQVIVSPSKITAYEADYDTVKKMRASIAVLGPLLVRKKKAIIAFPGGCIFGPRPINLHLEGLKALGAKVEVHQGFIQASANKLKGKTINLLGEFGPSVLATANVLMAAVLANGKTIIENAAREPEIADLIEFLKGLGAKIKETGTTVLEIEGVKKLGGGECTIISDRIEAGTFMIFAAITGGEIEIFFHHFEHLKEVFQLIKKIGAVIKKKKRSFIVKGKNPNDYNGFILKTGPYPFFPTDLQPLFLVLATIILKDSTIFEKIYPHRFSHADEIARMGANVQVLPGSVIIKGVKKLEGAIVNASDLRACAALIAGALTAKGVSEIRNVQHIERGYENISNKLVQLGADLLVEE